MGSGRRMTRKRGDLDDEIPRESMIPTADLGRAGARRALRVEAEGVSTDRELIEDASPEFSNSCLDLMGVNSRCGYPHLLWKRWTWSKRA
jgi:hypothetical protein